ncbi:MAG TPA: hypothetical protein DIW67_05205 [Pseudomonas sp.]|nr:hypothetical protein [Pseudomonas sp.]
MRIIAFHHTTIGKGNSGCYPGFIQLLTADPALNHYPVFIFIAGVTTLTPSRARNVMPVLVGHFTDDPLRPKIMPAMIVNQFKAFEHGIRRANITPIVIDAAY